MDAPARARSAPTPDDSYFYDSLGDVSAAEDADVIELCDIGAAIGTLGADPMRPARYEGPVDGLSLGLPDIVGEPELVSVLGGVGTLADADGALVPREADPGGGALIHEAPTPELSEGPVEQVARSQAAAAIERFLAGLPSDQRVVFELFEIEGLRANEIAESLGVNINTIYTRLRVARQRFAAFVAALQDDGGTSHGRG